MNADVVVLINYRLERAHESLKEAKILLEQGHTNTYVNRLYYACFYTVSALLLKNGLTSGKHSGIRAMFHQNFIKNSLIDAKLGRLYDKLFDSRQKGDYMDLVRFELNDVADWYAEADNFIESVEKLINN
ncbi:MAG: HEPN domain-containing protein [Candidatus Schekmanbacteria bacterium]|nr:HEPN domain-containing protein [Candidatus Schekmanbacteria bacterium]